MGCSSSVATLEASSLGDSPQSKYIRSPRAASSAGWKDSAMRPLLSRSDRGQVKSKLQEHMQPPRQILATIAKIKSVMKRWLEKARLRIQERAKSSDDQEPRNGIRDAPSRTGPEEQSLHDRGGTGGAVADSPVTAEVPSLPSVPINIDCRYKTKGVARTTSLSTWTLGDDMHDQLADADRRSSHISQGTSLIDQRVRHLQLVQTCMEDDGNSLFSAIAHQIYGDAEKHTDVRRIIVSHMREVGESEYAFLFASDAEFEEYLDLMGEDGALGDELTLRAACDTFGIIIHLLTSEPGDAYYWQYLPSLSATEDQCVEYLDVFLGFVVPTHFNSIGILPAS